MVAVLFTGKSKNVCLARSNGGGTRPLTESVSGYIPSGAWLELLLLLPPLAGEFNVGGGGDDDDDGHIDHAGGRRLSHRTHSGTKGPSFPSFLPGRP